MPLQQPLTEYDPLITIQQRDVFGQFGESAFLGNWFVFLKANAQVPTDPSQTQRTVPQILFRGKETLPLPGVEIQPTPLPHCTLVSLTSDKTLYRANRDIVRLFIASPNEAKQEILLSVSLNSQTYADYPVTLDEFGLCLYPLRDLPEGEYVATLVDSPADACRFEVAEYRLAALNAELVEQQLSGDTLRYILSVTTFNTPYSGPLEIELQERGQRVGERSQLRCNRDGLCRGTVKLSGVGPYTLNIIVGERTATIALKGSEQERREMLTISELGELRVLSLLPTPQANQCRGMYISRGGANTEPFLARRLVGNAIEITPRADIEALRVVTVNPVRETSGEKYYEQLKAEQSIQVPVPPPYGIILLGAFIDGHAWEGWCAVLRPSELSLQCEAPKEAKPGSRVTVTLKTGVTDRVVPVQLIVKDQRLIAQSDTQMEFAARIKANISTWQKQSVTGTIERQLSQVNQIQPVMFRRAVMGTAFVGVMPMMAAPGSAGVPQVLASSMRVPVGAAGMVRVQATATTAVPTQLTNVRLSFPEVVYNSIVKVQGEAQVEVKLGDSMTRYSIEAFALSPETLDWQRVETTLETTQQVYGELTVSPFVFPGDPVMGRLDVGAASGAAMVEVQHDGEVLPLFSDTGSAITPGLPIPSGTVVRFPVRPGTITSVVRDARKGGSDVSERYVTEPGRLRHIVRRLRLLTPGAVVTLQDTHALELHPMPGLERPFQVFVEAASQYPYGCVEQTSTKLFAMYVGYITNHHDEKRASEYEAAILAWHKRLVSMYLPQSGFCLYPPQEGVVDKPDTHYAPLAVKHLLDLPVAEQSGAKSSALLSVLSEIRAMANDAATYYKIENPPHMLHDCHDAYRVLTSSATVQTARDEAVAFVRSRLKQRNGNVSVVIDEQNPLRRLFGAGVAARKETAYAAAVLLKTGETSDLSLAIAATNTLTSQINAEGRLYSTVDTAACLALMTALRDAGVLADDGNGRVAVNGQEMSLADALVYREKVEAIQCVQGVVAAQITSEVIEDWHAFKSQLAVEVRLERRGQIQEQFSVGDELDLVIKVRQYEPGLLAHVCLPDALARIVGGGQVKRFSLDFCEKNELRVPLAAINSTQGATDKEKTAQHWAVIVRNMFKEEQVGNPGLLEVMVKNK
ncbi:MAG: hypothetical protein NVSMB38_37390 [Ktedonobacteraceae bacterium]